MSPRAAASFARVKRFVGRRRGGGGHAGLRALLVQRLRQPVVTLPQLRVELHGLLERRNRSRQVPCLAKRLPELVVHTRIRRIPLGDDAQVLERLLGLAHLAERHPEVHVRREAVRLERQRLLECRRRLAEVAALHERRAEVRVRAAVPGIELDGLAQFGNRAGEVRRCRERDTEPVARLRRPGRELHGPAERLERTRVVVLAHVRHPEQHVQLRVLRVLLQLLLELLCCLGDGHRVFGAGDSAGCCGTVCAADAAATSSRTSSAVSPRRVRARSPRARPSSNGDVIVCRAPPVSAGIHGCHRSGSSNRICSRDEASSTSRRVLA